MQESPYLVFNMYDYKCFILSKIEKIHTRKNSLTEEEVIDYCSQFSLSVKEFFPDKNQSTTSEKLRSIFGCSLRNKPKSVYINNYLLFTFGFIFCNSCNSILDKEQFYKSENSWHGYKHYCIDCQKEYRNLEDSQKYIKNNRDKYNAYLAKYRASKLQATPKWLTKEHYSKIQEFYTEAKAKNLEVDHIVSLQGENVCGLHVPWNLQLLSRKDNASKGNKVPLDYKFAGEPIIAR